MENEVELLHEKMTCSRTGRILLAVSWCTKEMSKSFHMFPEVCSWDVTMGTKAERRGLLIGCVYNSCFKSIPIVFSFMPNLRRWPFQWVARRALPMLHSKEVTNKIQLMLIDEDYNEISAFQHVPGLYKNQKSRICYYHGATLRLQPILKHLRSTNNFVVEDVVNKFDTMIHIISDEVETEAEYKLIFNLAKIWIDAAISRSLISPSQSTELMNQLVAIGNKSNRISNYVFMDRSSFKKITTSSNEVRHKNLKYGSNRVQPNGILATTAKRLVANTNDALKTELQNMLKISYTLQHGIALTLK